MSRENDYSDIINLPHHVSEKCSHMSMIDRAAQFSPFAALTGHDAALQETARLTDGKAELDNNEKYIIDEKLRRAAVDLTEISIIYFLPDIRKSGGAYLTAVGYIKKIDTYKNEIIMSDGKAIPVEHIMGVEIK